MTRTELRRLWQIHDDSDGMVTRCAFCGLLYLHESPSDRAIHRAEHRRYASSLPPRADKHIAALQLPSGVDLVVSHNSPRWMHQMVYERARRLMKEQHYDFPQWQPDGSHWEWSDEHPDPPHAILLIENQNIAVGTVCFNNGRHWTNVAPGWMLMFAWVAPEWRRQGVLSRRWTAWREQYGDFLLDPPLSEAMKAFAERQGHPTKIQTLPIKEAS